MSVFLNSDKNHKVLEVLLKHKAKIDAADNHGWTALHYSVFKGIIMMDVLRPSNQTHNLFSLSGFEDHVRVLLNYNADQFKKNEHQKTALDIAKQRVKINKKQPQRQRILDLLQPAL